jgi:uncharacterized protein YcbX
MSTQSTKDIGAVKTLWRYAVKSMNGEDLDEASIAEGGILGDRAYAVIDQSNGKVASAKYPKKWSKLIELSARFVQPPRADAAPPPVRITWPTGEEVVSDAGDVNALISEAVGRPVTLTTARPENISLERLDPLEAEETILDIGELMMEGRFSDYAALHLLTTATLARLSELRPESQFDAKRFRPNLVVETAGDQSGFIENDWVGRTVAIGDDVRLRVSDPTPRCSIPTLAQTGLPKDPKVLRTIVEHNRLAVPLLEGEMLPCAGVYAFVVQGGTVRRGDPVRVE